jgi:hypothetical protein
MAEEHEDLIATVLEGHPELVEAARRIFEYTAFLLDDDEKLTRGAALNQAARELLRERILEVVDPAAATVSEEREGEEEAS